MSKIQVGQRFGRLMVVSLIYARKNPKAECRCDCGAVVTPQRGALLNGRAKSCGCLRRELLAVANLKHGLSKTPEFSVFMGMRDRCENSKNPDYDNYGGRGICVLYKDAAEFVADVGLRPNGAWIERSDNDAHYGPGNCLWVTPAKNAINKRVSKTWTINGVEYESSVIAAKALGVTPSVVVRGCNGFTRDGRAYAPRDGWACRLKYGKHHA